MTKNNLSEELAVKFKQIRPKYEKFTIKLKALLQDLLEAKAVEFHLIESRTKEELSFLEKMNRSSKSYENPLIEITDISGLRVITYYQDHADAISRLIESEFLIDEANTVKQTTNPDEFGYKSAHFAVSITKGRSELLEWREFEELKAEIQVRTVLQHAWAAISHKLQYKREEDVPASLRRKLFRLSALFELADDEFIALREASSILSQDMASRISSGERDILIDCISLSKFIDSSPIVEELAANARKVGFYFGGPMLYDEEINSTSDLVAFLNKVEIQTLSQLERILSDSTSWSKEYLKAQYVESIGKWNVTPEFVCQLILIAVFVPKIDSAYLLTVGWDDKIANRVTNIAELFMERPGP